MYVEADQYHEELRPYWTGLHLTIYVECQRSVPVQEAVYPIYSKAGSKGVKFGVVDGHLTQPYIIHHTRAHVFIIPNLLLSFTKCFSCLALTAPYTYFICHNHNLSLTLTML